MSRRLYLIIILFGVTFCEMEDEILEGEDMEVVHIKDATMDQFPWQAIVHIKKKRHEIQCDGVLISKEWIVTPGHCINRALDYKIVLGPETVYRDSTNITYLNVAKHIIHEKFDKKTNKNDIALLRLKSPVKISANIKPVQLGTTPIPRGVVATLSGWGYTNDMVQKKLPRLKVFQLETVSMKECSEYFVRLQESMMCAAETTSNLPQDVCAGGSGFPLVTYEGKEPTLIGFSISNTRGICKSNRPIVFTRIAKFRDWIKSHTGV